MGIPQSKLAELPSGPTEVVDAPRRQCTCSTDSKNIVSASVAFVRLWLGELPTNNAQHTCSSVGIKYCVQQMLRQCESHAAPGRAIIRSVCKHPAGPIGPPRPGPMGSASCAMHNQEHSIWASFRAPAKGCGHMQGSRGFSAARPTSVMRYDIG